MIRDFVRHLFKAIHILCKEPKPQTKDLFDELELM